MTVGTIAALPMFAQPLETRKLALILGLSNPPEPTIGVFFRQSRARTVSDGKTSKSSLLASIKYHSVLPRMIPMSKQPAFILGLRKRTPIACIHCRKRKIKCKATNGYDKPCERCTRRKFDCEYISVAEESERSPASTSTRFGDIAPPTLVPHECSSTPNYSTENQPTNANRFLNYRPGIMAPICPFDRRRIFPNQLQSRTPWNNAYNTHYHQAQMHPHVIYDHNPKTHTGFLDFRAVARVRPWPLPTPSPGKPSSTTGGIPRKARRLYLSHNDVRCDSDAYTDSEKCQARWRDIGNWLWGVVGALGGLLSAGTNRSPKSALFGFGGVSNANM
ncbi:hypothetical protein FB45DRAFT_1096180 [Roridomyces roridus]|uniref:Zn(2)-C6 fungal-type domain-containing protein n=1 Tax=Roridomyces roridus TaxID=1738132 RepID=A0AAD7BG16_9AGAR|nr:hypothetical protein FB45DRAFT_1096180 [Roridomyces roridus]